MILFALFLALLGCGLDAVSTNKVIWHGGREANLDWLIGSHPSPLTVWVGVFFAPVALACVGLSLLPEVWPGVAIGAIYRMWVAHRNFELVKRLRGNQHKAPDNGQSAGASNHG